VANCKWSQLSCEQKRREVARQLVELGPILLQPAVTCLCGAVRPIQYMYRCIECGMFWCRQCAEKHFADDQGD